VATVLENTIGNVWFTYDSVGNYSLNSSGLFLTQSQNFFLITPTWLVGDAGGYPEMQYGGINSALVLTYDNGQSGSDDLLNNTPIEIRVYN